MEPRIALRHPQDSIFYGAIAIQNQAIGPPSSRALRICLLLAKRNYEGVPIRSKVASFERKTPSPAVSRRI